MKTAPLYSEVCQVSSFRRKPIFGVTGGGGLPGWFGLYTDRLDIKVFFLPYASIKTADIENIEMHKSLLGTRARVFSRESDIVVSISVGDAEALDTQLRQLHVKVTGNIQANSKPA